MQNDHPDGEVRHAIFQVDYFETPELARQFWNLPSEDFPDPVQAAEYWPNTHQSWLGESFQKCGMASTILQWRQLRVGNVMLHVGLFTSDRSPNDPYVTDLSKDLILSMAR